jgi:hypothetical protein
MAFVVRRSSFVIRPGNKKPRRSNIAWGRIAMAMRGSTPVTAIVDFRLQILD